MITLIVSTGLALTDYWLLLPGSLSQRRDEHTLRNNGLGSDINGTISP